MAGNGLSIGSGLARGLAGVLMTKRNQDRDQQLRDEDRQNNLRLVMLGRLLDDPNVNPDDAIAASGLDLNGGVKPTKGAPDNNAVLSGLLGSIAPSGPDVQNDGSPTKFVSDAVSGVAKKTAPPAAPQRTMLGIPLTSAEDKLQSQIDTQRALTSAAAEADTQAKLDRAARMRELNPNLSVEQSLIDVGLKSKPEDKFKPLPVGAGVFNTESGTITEPASAKVEKLTGNLGDRTREILAMNPELDEPTARAQAAEQLVKERADEKVSAQAARDSIAANRAITRTLLQMQADQGGITPNNAAALTTSLRKEFEKAVVPFRSRQTYVAKLDEGIRHITDKTRADGKPDPNYRITAAQTVVNSFNRILEETNAVKEGEYKRSEEMTPIVSRLEALRDRILLGGNRLTDEQLLSIANEGKQIATVVGKVHEDGLRDTRTAMESQLKKYKIDPVDVFGNSSIGKQQGFSAVLDGTQYSFENQAKLDAFKRQFPNAK